MSMPPRGWYQDPDEPASRQRFWDGKVWSERTRPTPGFMPPDIDGLQTSRLPFVAIILALVGSALAIPFFVRSFSFSALPGQTYPGWRETSWYLAFFVGSPSFVLALVSRHRERERRSLSGKRFAGVAVAVALFGACVWSFPACIQASTGL